MHLTQKTDYALRVLIYMGKPKHDLVQINDISLYFNIPKSHVMKIVADLVKCKYLDSVRGHGGGLRLNRAPELINLGEVVKNFESFDLVECMKKDNHCVISNRCGLAPILSGALKSFLDHLDQYTLADIL